MTSRRVTVAGLVVIAVCAALIGRAATGDHVAAPPSVELTGATAAGRDVTFSVMLERGAEREQALDRFLRALDEPGSPSYRKFIDAATFGRRFGAPAARIDRVAAWLRGRGMRVDSPQPQRTSLRVHATAAQLRSTFDVALADYRDPAGHRWHEPVSAPRVPAALAGDVVGLAGMSDRPHYALVSEAGAPGEGYDAAALGRVYDFQGLWKRGLHGEGQGIAVINFDPYRPKDIAAFDADQKATGLPPVTLVKIDGGAVADPKDAASFVEPALDIETIRGLAPQAAIYEYEAPQRTEYPTIINQIVADGHAKTISLSWGACDYQNVFSVVDRALLDVAVRSAAASGVNMVVSSGDNGAYGCWRSRRVSDADKHKAWSEFPSCSTYTISVGGTRLTLDGQGQLVEETGWEGWMSTQGTGGGPSHAVPMPAYQASVARADAGGHRQCPDVAADADSSSGYRIVFSTSRGPVAVALGGTSGAAPLWAAAVALINQRAEQAGIANLGHLTPILYRLAAAGSPGIVDVTRGGNLVHDAEPGYDYATGLGTPRVAALADAIVADQGGP
jgi:kumamolisin